MDSRTLKVVKPEIRVLGIDDGRFVPHSKGQALVVGVVFRAGNWLEGVMSTNIEVDGLDATPKLADMILTSRHYRQLRVIMLNGITFGGFNVVDIKALHSATGKPVIAVTEKTPNMASVQSALKNLNNYEERRNAILNAGEIFPVVTRGNKQRVYVEVSGLTKEASKEILRLTATRSKIPEPLRVAHLVASGIQLYIR